MVYEALVIDNANFAKKGTIRVRIQQRCATPTLMRDLSENPKRSIDEFGNQQYVTRNGENVFTYVDTDVKVSSLMGGGYDYGIFYLPQPNSWGLVAQIGDPWNESSRDNFVWIGALYQRNALTGNIHVPNSDLVSSKDGVEGGNAFSSNFSSTFIMKTKTTEIAGGAENINQEESKKTLNFKNRPTENLIVIDKDQIQIIHNVLDDTESKAVETIQIDRDGFIINYNNKEKGQNSFFKLKDNGDFEINKEADDATIDLLGNSDGVSIEYVDSKGSGANLKLGKKDSATMGKNKTEATLSAFENGSNSCTVSVKSDGILIESGKDITLAATGSVTLGNTGLPVLVSPTGLDVIIGNVTIPCSPSVIG